MFSNLYFLPLVGLLRGGVTVVPLVVYSLSRIEGAHIIAFTAIAFHFISQGFLHADGLIDFAEAILAHRFGVDGYKVVKDRYRGSYAIAAFSVYTLGLFSVVTALIERLSMVKLMGLLVISEVWSTMIIMLISYFGREPPEGIGRMFKRNLSLGDVVVSLVLSSTISLTLTFTTNIGFWFLVATLIALVFVLVLSRALAHKVLGFVNGDVLGFSSEFFYLITLISYWVVTWI